jgi:crotonobetainyl-CoA:carnitine CoA-transferase CaiB-like acyl-CoA transferase
MLDVLEAPEIANDSRFRENVDRMANLKELEDILSSIFVEHSTDNWLRRLQDAGVPAGPVLNVNQMHEDPHTHARDMIVEVEHSRIGPVKTIGLPVKFSETPGRVATGAPVYGQHTREVLAECGYDETAVEEMIADGAVVAAD